MEAMLADLDLEPVLVNSVYQEAAHAASASRAGGRARLGGGQAVVREILARAEAGERLSGAEAVVLHDHAGLGELGQAAQRRRMRLIPRRAATFVVDRNISLTNVCEADCLFCAFHVPVGSPDAFVLSVGRVVELVEQAQSQGATQVLIQGGLNPQLDLAFHEAVLRAIKRRCRVWVHSLSPAEVVYLATRAGLSVEQTLGRLREAGLDSLPGGGAEILVDEVRRRVSPRKITAGQWLAVMETAQRMGMLTTATMVYGLGETTSQRVEHLLAVRGLQDRTGGFTAFIPWSCQTNRTRIALRPCTGVDYLRMVALSRLVLDNVPHVQAGWVTEGPDVAQLALSFGADDFGGVLMEERVVRATGLSHAVTVGQVVDLIGKAGYLPVQRNTRYEEIAALG
jgi:cyclic dehypoxanthinyl futalosine synthase